MVKSKVHDLGIARFKSNSEPSLYNNNRFKSIPFKNEIEIEIKKNRLDLNSIRLKSNSKLNLTKSTFQADETTTPEDPVKKEIDAITAR